MTPPAHSPMPIEEQVIAALARCGAMSVTDLRRVLREYRVRCQELPQVLTRLHADGRITKGSRIKIGADRRRRSVTTFLLPRDGTAGGSWQPDAVVLVAEPIGGSGADMVPDVQSADGAVCPGCGQPWPGPGYCGDCSSVPGWHP